MQSFNKGFERPKKESAGGLKNFFGNGTDGVLNTAGNVSLTSVVNGTSIIKQYESITINSGHTLTLSQPCQGLVLYSKGDVVINGTINMSEKAGIAPKANIIPMLISNFKITTPNGLSAFNELTTTLLKLTGGAGGNGGYGGGYSGSTGRQSSVGSGGQGRQNLGGFGGGGSGGAAGGGSNGLGGVGGTVGGLISAPEMGGGYLPSYVLNLDGNNGQRRGTSGVNGSGAAGGVFAFNANTVTFNQSGQCRGGGGGGGVIALFHKGAYSNDGSITVNGGSGGSVGAGAGSGESGAAGTSGSVGTIHTQKL